MKNNEDSWTVLSSLEIYKIPEGKAEDEFKRKNGAAN